MECDGSGIYGVRKLVQRDLGNDPFDDAFLRVNLYLKEFGDKSAEPKTGHLGSIVLRVKHG